MPQDKRARASSRIGFDEAHDVLAATLRGPARRDVVDHALAGGSFEAALKRLRSGLRAHTLPTAGAPLELRAVVQALDARSRAEGFHVLLEWEQAAGRFSRDEVPVLMLDHLAAAGAVSDDRRALAILVDFYLLYVLGLLLMRAWDDGDPNDHFDRVSALLGDLQGPEGSGEQLAEGAGTLLFIATSNFQPDDAAYHRLLHKVRALDEPHRVHVARIGAAVVGTHLRWAFSAIYEHDLLYMRKDNFVDYPWLFFSVATLLREYARLAEAGADRAGRAEVAGALLNGLSADPWAFTGKPPDALAEFAGEHAAFRELFARQRDRLLDDFEALTPSKHAYSPLSLQFNFPHNTLVARVVLALPAEGGPNVPVDALLTASPSRPHAVAEQALHLARAMTGYAAAHPERRGERRVLQVAYNEAIGLRGFSRTMTALRKAGEPTP
jgi:hypothetical protein